MIADRQHRSEVQARTGPVRYLRLSLTERCPMRCLYCRPSEGLPQAGETLTPGEIESLVRHLVAAHGLEKVRLTGGEPTERRDLLEIISRLAAIDGLTDLALTTGGLTLVSTAERLARAGLRRVNISLDSLRPDVFRRITGRDALPRVLEGIDAARAAGLEPVRLNTVVLGGLNDAELPDLAAFAAEKGIEIRFIEFMPMGPRAAQWRQWFVPEHRMRAVLDPHVAAWQPMPWDGASARRWRLTLRAGGEAAVGFISAMSHPFCAACGRLRVAADGTLYPCLMDEPAGNVLPALRPALRPRELDGLIEAGLRRKAAVHPAVGPGVMTCIGG